MPVWLQQLRRTETVCSLSEFIVLLAITAYFMLFGLVPYFGGDRLGLVGADEPPAKCWPRIRLTAMR